MSKQSAIGASVAEEGRIGAMVMQRVLGVGIERDVSCRMMVMRMMFVMLDLAMYAAQHLGNRWRDHAQQNGKHSEPGTDFLTVTDEHGESARRQKNERYECYQSV